MIPLALLCILAVSLVAWVHLGRAGSRPLSERLVDGLYRIAISATAGAQATDAGLCRYRAALRDIKHDHATAYGRQAMAWRQEGD